MAWIMSMANSKKFWFQTNDTQSEPLQGLLSAQQHWILVYCRICRSCDFYWWGTAFKTWSPVRPSQIDICWISITFLVIPTRILITYDLHRAAVAVWVVGCCATLFSKFNRAYIGLSWICAFDSLCWKKWKIWENKGKNHWCIFNISAG